VKPAVRGGTAQPQGAVLLRDQPQAQNSWYSKFPVAKCCFYSKLFCKFEKAPDFFSQAVSIHC